MDERMEKVIQKLNDMRHTLDPEERKVLDLIVGAVEDDEVAAHRFDLKSTPKIELRIENQIYKMVEK